MGGWEGKVVDGWSEGEMGGWLHIIIIIILINMDN